MLLVTLDRTTGGIGDYQFLEREHAEANAWWIENGSLKIQKKTEGTVTDLAQYAVGTWLGVKRV